MKKIEEEKGITLVALIITIVVLLILAVVAIGAAKNSDIIGHAQNAARDYKINAESENGILEEYVGLLNNANSDNNGGGENNSTSVWAQRGLTVQPVESDLTYGCEGGMKFGGTVLPVETVLYLYSNGDYSYNFLGLIDITQDNSTATVSGGNTITLSAQGREELKFVISEDGATAKMYKNDASSGTDTPMWTEGSKTLLLNAPIKGIVVDYYLMEGTDEDLKYQVAAIEKNGTICIGLGLFNYDSQWNYSSESEGWRRGEIAEIKKNNENTTIQVYDKESQSTVPITIGENDIRISAAIYIKGEHLYLDLDRDYIYEEYQLQENFDTSLIPNQ